MKSHNSGGAVPVEGSGGGSDTAPPVTAVSIGAAMSKGLASAIKPLSPNSVIQTPSVNSPSVVNQATGATVTLARSPVRTAGSSAALNGSDGVSPAAVVASSATSQAGVAVQAPHVNHSQPANTVSISAAPRIIKAEPPTPIVLPAGTPSHPSVPQPPVTVAAGAGVVRPPIPEMLVPSTPQATPGQPSLHNIQLPPGECSHNFLHIQTGLIQYFGLVLKININLSHTTFFVRALIVFTCDGVIVFTVYWFRDGACPQ